MQTREDTDRRPCQPARLATCGCGRADCHDALATLAATAAPAARAALRDQVIEAHLALAYRIAARYHRPGPGAEDVRQVAALALVNAVDRFDPGRGTPFSAFAAPTIGGAVKRHFRDHWWILHPPRPVKDLRTRIRSATDHLVQHLHRVPTAADLAEYLDCTPEEIREAMHADEAAWPLSLDAPVRTAEDTTLAAVLGSPDRAYAHVENVETLRPLLAGLPNRTQRVLAMRFGHGMSQAEIAERVGCSQVHVSRILSTALRQLRRELYDVPAARVSTPIRGRGTANAPEPPPDLPGDAPAPARSRPPRRRRREHRGEVSGVCSHQPACPGVDDPDRATARTIASHPDEGWSILCNGMIVLDDGLSGPGRSRPSRSPVGLLTR